MGSRDLMVGVATMTSLELVALINSMRDAGKPEMAHADFMKKVARVLGEGSGKFSDTYIHAQNGQSYPCYRLPKREASLMVMSESYPVQAKVYDRMAELEVGSSVTLPDFTNPAIAARAWAEQFEAKLALTARVAADAPKVAFAEAIRSIDGVCHIEKIAKTIGIGRNKLFKKMRDDGILMQSNLPYQKYIDREYFTVNEQEPFVDSKGAKHPTFTAMVTGAGQVFLVRKYSPADASAK